MACTRKSTKTKVSQKKDVNEFPGIAIDIADKEQVNNKTVVERTAALNNNPRNTDDEMPG